MRGVVVGVNGSTESGEALDWALVEAASRGVPLTAVLAWQPPSRAAEPVEFARQDELHREEVLTLLDTARTRTGADVEATVTVTQGPAAEVLLAAGQDADLLVLGRRGTGRLGRMVLGSVSATVAEHARVPVTVVRERETPADGDARVVVGVDGSPPSVAALRHGAEVARRLGGVLEPVMLWQITTLAPLPDSWGWAPPLDDYEKLAGETLDAAVAQADPGLPEGRVRPRVVHAPASRGLLEAARGAERLVVGNRGLGGFDRLLLGSVSRQVLDHAGCPVTVVRA